jgi:sterol desaturase/sphingolipid hydroxylase (fatty acid hydroxylase superfamily)
MASEGAAIQATTKWPIWLLIGVYVVMVAMVPASYWIGEAVAPFASETSALAREHFYSSTLPGYAFAAALVAAWVVLVMLLQPLALVAGLMLIERAFGFRPRGNWTLAWVLRACYYALFYLFGLAVIRWSTWLPDPLLAPAVAELPTPLRIAGTVAALLASLLVADFFQYWIHRAFHRYPLLWRIHAVHHSPRRLGVLYNFLHPAEALALHALNLFLVALLIRVNAGEVWLVTAVIALQGHFLHMNVPVHFGRLRCVVADNRYHFLHHSRSREDFDCNFAGWFPILDRLFGTYRSPEDHKLCETGLEDRLPPRSLAGYLLARLPDSSSAAEGMSKASSAA